MTVTLCPMSSGEATEKAPTDATARATTSSALTLAAAYGEAAAWLAVTVVLPAPVTVTVFPDTVATAGLEDV